MFVPQTTETPAGRQNETIEALRRALAAAEAVVVGAGAGLSVAAGFSYSGARFRAHFGDFERRYGFRDMYSGGFYPYETPEAYWAYWSRYILVNRYQSPPKPTYKHLLQLLRDRDYFVLTTNVDHCFQATGFERRRLFYTQGDYGLWQCSVPCRQTTYDNEAAVRRMVAAQEDLRVPTELLPRCPVCGQPLSMNLRIDERFVEDAGWHAARARYEAYLKAHETRRVLFLELGCGMNTPGIVKFAFQRLTRQWPRAVYACVNLDEARAPREIEAKSICVQADIGCVLKKLLRLRE